MNECILGIFASSFLGGLRCLLCTISASFSQSIDSMLPVASGGEGIHAGREGIGHMSRSCWVSPSLSQLSPSLGAFTLHGGTIHS